MATKIRLQRHGHKNYAFYPIVIADSRAPRDGKFIERIGSYNPNTNPATISLNFERALYWINNGAIPTDTVRTILSREGVMLMKHLQRGVKKGAFSAEEAQKRFDAWKQAKDSKSTPSRLVWLTLSVALPRLASRKKLPRTLLRLKPWLRRRQNSLLQLLLRLLKKLLLKLKLLKLRQNNRSVHSLSENTKLHPNRGATFFIPLICMRRRSKCPSDPADPSDMSDKSDSANKSLIPRKSNKSN